MSKERKKSRTLDYALYLVVRAFVCAVSMLPPRWAYGLADGLAWLGYRVDKRHREVARENLALAFPGKSPERIDRLVRGTYRHFSRVLIEIVNLPRTFHAYNWGKSLSMRGEQKILDAMTSERPVLIVTGHFGNWELAGYALGGFGFKTYAIARVLDNPYLEEWFRKFRQGTGQTILAKKGDFDKITDVLADNGAIATLADQDAGKKGLFVDFFGRPASTHKAVALMAMESNAKMLVIGVPRVKEPDTYAIVCEDVIDPEEYAGKPDALRLITERYTRGLEAIIRKYPEQYFWLHRRWKHRPAVRKKAAA